MYKAKRLYYHRIVSRTQKLSPQPSVVSFSLSAFCFLLSALSFPLSAFRFLLSALSFLLKFIPLEPLVVKYKAQVQVNIVFFNQAVCRSAALAQFG